MLDMKAGNPQLRHLDHAWASTVLAFQGRTVDKIIAAMEAGHPQLTTQKSFYVEISQDRDRAELVTDDAKALREQLETATGERIAALEGIGAEKAKSREAAPDANHGVGREKRHRGRWNRARRSTANVASRRGASASLSAIYGQ